MGLLIYKYYLKKRKREREIHQKIGARAIEISKNIKEINISKEILWLKFFNKVLEHLSEIYFYKKLLAETDAGKKGRRQNIIIKIKIAKSKLKNLLKP